MIYPRLEKYKGPASRHTCPSCSKRKEFSRYVREDGSYISDAVGKCNRASCGYHYTPRHYNADNPGLNGPQHQVPKVTRRGQQGRETSEPSHVGIRKVVNPDYLDPIHLSSTVSGYEQNAFVQFLLGLFPNDPNDVERAIREYRIGTKDGFTVFPVIDRWQRFCKAQLIRYDQITGKRMKEVYSISSIESKLKANNLIEKNFETDKNVFFGEHLLTESRGRPIAVVESPKTAIIASICEGAFDLDFVWLACLGKDNLKIEKLERLGRDHTFYLFPDSKGYEKWQQIASIGRKRGLTIVVSDLVERLSTDDEKAKDIDLADLLIREQVKRNDPLIREAFFDLVEERLAIMTICGGLSEMDAEDQIEMSGFLQYALRLVLEN